MTFIWYTIDRQTIVFMKNCFQQGYFIYLFFNKTLKVKKKSSDIMEIKSFAPVNIFN